ncbi:hypothetical protein RXV86_07685 [Alisedimentitalea sp. MJ-SS2]|uniref:hypothetical protein n=1 Tax=Aliisedimentitalea sp. MJ-SS2 TaxID=3049795 RepID=UPI00290FC45A|nr:hypothetical protein [Alisedimentitalea sp. MJ-SS2]MDU8927261.1 hypothetical protein [Alisedimentitalea sp. MJ-SS2]
MKHFASAILIALASVTGQSALSQELVGSYVAVIGNEDLYNSKGKRLTQPWQILRQDRANYHRFGIRHRGDTGDNFFSSIENRAIMERMVMNGHIDPGAARTLVNGYSDSVLVRIYGRGNRGDYVRVTVMD